MRVARLHPIKLQASHLSVFHAHVIFVGKESVDQVVREDTLQRHSVEEGEEIAAAEGLLLLILTEKVGPKLDEFLLQFHVQKPQN